MNPLLCAGCGTPLQVESHFAGRHLTCPRCRQVSSAPAANGSADFSLAQERATLPPAPSSQNAATLPPSAAAVDSTAAGKSPHGYEILAELGRGGMGVVYKACQTALQRTVALKMILGGGHASAADLDRFRTEAESIARLQHPNIVQIYEVGEYEGLPFFSLEFCAGGSLAQKLNGTPLRAREAAALVEKLAGAVQAAHLQHVIHRDLKPANVLLAGDGTPKITDFGLAKKLDEASRTQSGAIMGTPSYMAPEQAGGKSDTIGPRADVYALGAILYECLTGRPPFKAATALDTIMQVVSDEPVAPSQLQTTTPRDLETICLKCLHKDARKRYASARDLAGDLRRFLGGEPIRARAVGQLERTAKWVKRNPLVTAFAGLAAALAALFVLSVLVGGAGILLKYWDAKEQEGFARTEAEAARAAESLAEHRKTIAEEREREAQYLLANSNILLTQAAWDSSNAKAARERLLAVPLDSRKWEWHYLNRLYQGGIFSLPPSSGAVTCVAFSPDGTRLATAGDDKTVRVWNARTGRPLLECKGHGGRVLSVVFSPDGTQFATAGDDRTARLWDARTGQRLVEYNGHTGVITAVAFTPDGTRLATSSGDKTVRLWKVPTGQLLLEFKGHRDRVMSVAVSPDGTRLATASMDGTARVWDAGTSKSLVECTGHASHVSSVAFSPDGTKLATASGDKTARLWDARTGQFLLLCSGHQADLTGVAFSPDGTRLATASSDKSARLWDARTGQPVIELKGCTSIVSSVAFSPDGTRLAGASYDGSAVLWDARTGQPVLECAGHTDHVEGVAWSPDGTRLATASSDKAARLWDVRTGQSLLVCTGHAGAVAGVALSPDGRQLATASFDSTARLWDAATGQCLLVCAGHTSFVIGVAWSADGTRLATASDDRTARLWDARTGQALLECKGHTAPVKSVAFSPDGTLLATASYDGTARLWDARTGQSVLECKGHTSAVSSVAFSPDGTRLATASSDGTARSWDARTGQRLKEFKGHSGPVVCVAFTPDGTRLATASFDKSARLWDARTGQPLLDLVSKGPVDIVTSVAFSPDGTRLATASWNGRARLWDARPSPLPPDEEFEYRLFATRPEPDWHEEQFKEFRIEKSPGSRFAAGFHLDRLLALQPSRRADLLHQRTQYLEGILKQHGPSVAARLLLARTAWHSPTLGPKDATALLTSADDKSLLARRTRGGLLLRQEKAEEAVPVLEAALKDRAADQPPVEELLLAWAYDETQQADKAYQGWTKAKAWLDRGQEAVRAANVVGRLPAGLLPGLEALFASPTHPRFSAFDWETWHELDVLRRELAPRFAARGSKKN